MDKLKFAIFGCGGIGEAHIQTLIKLPEAELIAGSETNIKRREYIRNKYNLKLYENHNNLLNNEKIDACIIATPHHTHSEIGIACAEKGIHLLVEKPIDKDYKKGELLVKYAEKNNVKLAVISQYRFSKGFRNLKKLVDSGELGKIFLINIFLKWLRSNEYYEGSTWRGKLDIEGGGTLITQCLHFLDQILWIFGDVDTVTAEKGTFLHNAEVEDTVTALARMKNGAICSIVSSCAIYPGFLERVEVNGTEGSAIVERDSLIFADSVKKSGKLTTPGKEIKLGDTAMFETENDLVKVRETEIKSFCNMVLRNNEPEVTGYDALKSLKFALGIYESINRKTILNMDEFKP